jgi:hypothetical protein
MSKALFKLSNVDIHEISVTKSPAVEEATVIVRKSDNSIQIETNIIHKNDKGQIFQYALVPNKPDKQGDVITDSEIEKATERLKKTIFDGGLRIGKEHTDFNNDVVDYAFTEYDDSGFIAKHYGFPEDKIVKGAMIVGMQLTEFGKSEFDNGNFKGISIGGIAEKEDIEKSINNNSNDIIKSLLSTILGIKTDINLEQLIKNAVNEQIEILKNDKTDKSEVKKSMADENKDQKLDETKTGNEVSKSNTDPTQEKLLELEKSYNEQVNNNKILMDSITELKDIVKNLSGKLDTNIETVDKLAKAKGVSKTNDPQPFEKMFQNGLFGDDEDQK